MDLLKGAGEEIVGAEDGLTSILESVDVLGLYFSAHWCGPCRAFTPKLSEFYNNMKSTDPSKLEILFVSSDQDEGAFEGYFKDMPWKALPFHLRDLKNELSSHFGVQGIPTLVLLDAKTGELITTDARSDVMRDPNGESFPWKPPTIEEVMSGIFVDAKGGTYEIGDFSGKNIMLYFSAHWCGPCRMFTPAFSEFYTSHSEEKNFEVIFVSSDQGLNEFQEYLSEMPWKAIPFENQEARTALGSHFKVAGIPALFVLDSELNVITAKGRGMVSSDPQALEFPWYPKPYEQLNSGTAMDLNDNAGMIVYCGPDESIRQDLVSFAESFDEKEDSPAMKLFYVDAESENDPIVGRVNTLVHYSGDQSMVILDIPKRRFAHATAAANVESIREFYENYNSGLVDVIPLE